MLYTKSYESPEDEEKFKRVLDTALNLFKEEIFESIKDKGCKKLIEVFLDQYGFEFAECVASATKHHKGIGGNLAHTLQVFRIVKETAKAFPLRVNTDVAYTGAVLHDIGKIFCYDEKDDNMRKRKTGELDEEGKPIYTLRPKDPFKQSDEAKVMGHFGEALYILTRLINENDIPISKKDERAIYHIIASHHGENRLGWGSLVSPNTLEAHLVFMADYLSAKVE